MSAAQCKKPCGYRSRALVINEHTKHFDCDLVVVAKWAGLSIKKNKNTHTSLLRVYAAWCENQKTSSEQLFCVILSL